MIAQLTAYELASKMNSPLLPPTFNPTALRGKWRWCNKSHRLERVRYVHEDTLAGQRIVTIGCGCGTPGHISQHVLGVIRDE